MKIVLTGAAGFLGWHTRVRLRALTDHEVVPVTRDTWDELPGLLSGADAVVHLAGVNRAQPAEVEHGNLALARDLAEAIRRSQARPTIVYANSIHADGDTPYGLGKRRAGDLLAGVAQDLGLRYADLRLPNLFGEHGRPRYNSFVATFVDAIIRGERPEIADRPVRLLHAQRAAAVLLEALTSGPAVRVPAATPTTVLEVYERLRADHATYTSGDIPPLLTDLDVDLFNTLRAAQFPASPPIPLTTRADDRGALVEVVRAHGGQGQTFVSTTRPGVTRGEHFHLRKVERFAVIGGQARISLRRLFDEQVVSFDVTGDSPVVVDMPTMWAHNITNVGAGDLTTVFWASELFDPAAPDTFAEPVEVRELVGAGGQA